MVFGFALVGMFAVMIVQHRRLNELRQETRKLGENANQRQATVSALSDELQSREKRGGDDKEKAELIELRAKAERLRRFQTELTELQERASLTGKVGKTGQ
ncbi:MAG: hypothetical protein JWM04_1170 [Verrucomicrobiales bacterium]|nr:hypothetical protein [Verrucomicrobiales bacterium]